MAKLDGFFTLQTKQEKQQQKMQIPKKVTAKETTKKTTKNKKEENKKKIEKNDNKKTENKYQKFWVNYAEKQKLKKIESKNPVANVNPDSDRNCGEGFDTAKINPDKRCTIVQMAEGQTDGKSEAA